MVLHFFQQTQLGFVLDRLVGRTVSFSYTHLDVYKRQPQLHLIFTGYPGTGKNTVAEMVGELYQKLGLLSHGRVNHYSRRDLVREGTAAEEQLVRQALNNSMGGILFVDQAGDCLLYTSRCV